MDDVALNVEGVAKKLGIAKNTVYELIKRGELKSYKVGRKVRIDPADLNIYIENSKNVNTGVVSNEEDSSETFIISGQDKILDILANMIEVHPQGVRVLRSYNCSFPGLISLYYDKAQIAAVHLWDSESCDYNLSYVKKLVPGTPCIIIHLAKRFQGFYVQQGNPKGIKSWIDLSRDDVKMINREKGSGTRILLDEMLTSHSITPGSVNGYYKEKTSHSAVANHIANGLADVAIGSEAGAIGINNIEFVPLKTESYDLVLKKENFNNPLYKIIYDIINSEEYHNSIKNYMGYDFSETGKIVAET